MMRKLDLAALPAAAGSAERRVVSTTWRSIRRTR